MRLRLRDWVYIETFYRIIHPDRYLGLKFLEHRINTYAHAVRGDGKSGTKLALLYNARKQYERILRGEAA